MLNEDPKIDIEVLTRKQLIQISVLLYFFYVICF